MGGFGLNVTIKNVKVMTLLEEGQQLNNVFYSAAIPK